MLIVIFRHSRGSSCAFFLPSYFVICTQYFFPLFQTHPQQNMIASGSIESDLSIKIWVDRGPNAAPKPDAT